MRRIVFIIMALIVSLLAEDKVKFYKPSFDCLKVKQGSAEYKICTNEELSKLDIELSKYYYKAFNKPILPIVLKREQREWLKKRNKCKNKMCISELYLNRIAELKNLNKYLPKSITLDKKQFSNKYIGYYLYKSDEDIIMRILYSVSNNNTIDISYSIYTGKILFKEEYSKGMYQKTALNFNNMLNKQNFKKVKNLERQYESGWYYSLFEQKVFSYQSSRCGSPFDNRYKVVNRDGSIYMEKSILMKDNFTFISKDTCLNMEGNYKIEVPISSVGIDKVWKINDGLYAISIFDYPAVFFMDKTFSLDNKYNNLEKFTLVDYEWLKRIINKIKEDEYNKTKDFPGLEFIANKVFKIINKRED